MNAKDKARDLVWDFYNIQSNEYDYGMNWEMAKQCALIAVNEILNEPDSSEVYWNEVKQEIDNL
jgi:hypothetical protein